MRRSMSSMGSSQDCKEKLYVFKHNTHTPLSETDMSGDDGVGFPCVSLQGQGATSPPVQGRSVREFEEQMASLRKENFNLKLRLYFLEESVPGYHQANTEGHESLMKQLIDTKVEIEILRKELEEKQELLKEAAQAMNHMEEIQKETETKAQAFIEELKQKIQFLEMERDMDKSQQSGFMNDLLGRSEISENVNTLQKIRELEGMVTQSEEKIGALQAQNSKFEDIIAMRDEAIKEYEDKVKELAFQHAELQEMMENKEKDMANIELTLKSLRLCNADLKEDNGNLIEALKSTQDNFRKEFTNMKVCEKRMREQQDALSKMQSTISIKTANTARLLERIQDYEKMVTKMNFERNLAKKENRFFRAIIGKLQRSKANECFTIEKEEIYQQYAHEFDEKPVDCNKHYEMNYRDMLKARGDFHGEYLLKQKLSVNYSNSAKYNKVVERCEQHDHTESNAIVKSSYHRNDVCSRHRSIVGMSKAGDGYCRIGLTCDELQEHTHEPEFPIRYTISDANMFASCEGGGCGGCDGGCSCSIGGSGRGSGSGAAVGCYTPRSNSCTSLQGNFSTSNIFCGEPETCDEKDVDYLQAKRHNPITHMDGVRFVYSKFGNY
uniref:Centrosomin n=1 Tax=Ceratitis capitata TaxID=7213 RepID=W8AV66_CERCA